jgi:alpha-1,6-mannosyltransferase
MIASTGIARSGTAIPPIWRLLAYGLGVLLLTGATPFLFEHLGDNFFIAQAILCGVLVAYATRVAERCPEHQGLAVIIGLAVLLRVILLAIPPLTSGDIFRYVWDGRMQAAGFNPFSHFPAAPELRALRDAVIFPYVDKAGYAVTIYPPASQLFFLLVTRIHESVLAMKIALVACEAVTIAAVIALLRRVGRPVTRVVAYAWHPLVIWEIANNGHIDAAMVAMMMLAVWLFAAGRRLAAAAAAAVGALFKPFAVLVLPALWRPWDWKSLLVFAVVVAVFYLPYLSAGTGALGFLPMYASEERLDSGSAFWLLETLRPVIGSPAWAVPLYLGGSLAILAGLALRAGFRKDRPLAVTLDDINALLLAFSFLLSPDHPWYFLMLAPFIALTGSIPGWVLTVGGFALYDVIPWDPQVPFWLRDAAFNLAVLAVMILSLRRARIPRAGQFGGAPA